MNCSSAEPSYPRVAAELAAAGAGKPLPPPPPPPLPVPSAPCAGLGSSGLNSSRTSSLSTPPGSSSRASQAASGHPQSGWATWGGWRAQAGEKYVQTARRRMEIVQNSVAERIRDIQPGQDPFDEAEVLDRVTAHLERKGVQEEIIEDCFTSLFTIADIAPSIVS